MPLISVTQAGGTTPAVAANTARSELILQNNSTRDVFYRFYGAVSPSVENQRGLMLRRGGGTVIRNGAAAQTPVYLCHADGDGVTAQVTVESDV